MADVQLADLGAVIKQAYESQANTNAFTNDEKVKLAGIEAGAEVNPDAAEIKSLYESNEDTNAFTDAEKLKLAGIEAGAEVNPTDEEIVAAYDSVVPAASQQEAEAGTEQGIRRWSPLRIKQAIEALAPGGGGGPAEWGQITGTLSDQGDLQAALDAKADEGHGHILADISDAGALAAKDKVENEDLDIGAVTKTKLAEDVRATDEDIDTGTAQDVFVTPAGLEHFGRRLVTIDARSGAQDFTKIEDAHCGKRIKTDRNMIIAKEIAADQVFMLRNVHSTNAIELAPEAGTINGAASIEVAPQGMVVVVVEDNQAETLVVEASGDIVPLDLPAGTQIGGETVVTAEGDQLVSTEANNLLTANPLFWVGEAANEPSDPPGTLVIILEEES